ncbi:protein of unknown function DUF559 [Cyanobacterium stanieri PCC 7202]|uniref:DUF559 domain-containing protein n=1 Tax=Cyanobacterium stanieri (strain ATCC 29140 / PCC 7202) TaxID=292563 RepID=K9YQJ5_CYASC|nr:protein of unknown function DUF559 [Cyanobacterium stanieri PCC 7202]
MNFIRGTTPEVREAAKRLRHQLTPAEKALWERLRNKQVHGLKFRCQHPVGDFILDFYCPSIKLVIEIDGSYHDDRQEYDQCRTEKLAEHGYRVIRFKNEEVLNNIDKVIIQISRYCDDLQSLAP